MGVEQRSLNERGRENERLAEICNMSGFAKNSKKVLEYLTLFSNVLPFPLLL